MQPYPGTEEEKKKAPAPEETEKVNTAEDKPQADFFDDWDAAFNSDNDTPAAAPAATSATPVESPAK